MSVSAVSSVTTVQSVVPSEIYLHEGVLRVNGASIDDVAVALRDYRYRQNIGPYVPQSAIEQELLDTREFSAVFSTTYLASLVDADLSVFGETTFTDADPDGIPRSPSWRPLRSALEPTPSTSSCSFRLVHSRIRPAQDVVGHVVRLGHDQPDACAQQDPLPTDDDRAANLVEEAHRRRLRLSRAPDVFDHRHEFVATKPGDHVASASRGLQSVCQRLEELVAGRVAQPIVHVLEPVQIEEQDGDPAPPSPGPRERTAEVLRQEVPVGQAGQRDHGGLGNGGALPLRA